MCVWFCQVPISQGMKHEQRLPFRGQADELVSSVCIVTGRLFALGPTFFLPSFYFSIYISPFFLSFSIPPLPPSLFLHFFFNPVFSSPLPSSSLPFPLLLPSPLLLSSPLLSPLLSSLLSSPLLSSPLLSSSLLPSPL